MPRAKDGPLGVTQALMGLLLQHPRGKIFGLMSRWLLLMTVFSWVAAAAAVSADEVDDFINAQLRTQRIPGLALAVVKDDRVVKVAGYGVADRTTNTPVTADTVFRVGSISKPIL